MKIDRAFRSTNTWSKRAQHRRQDYRLSLERLEDRLAPAQTLTWDGELAASINDNDWGATRTITIPGQPPETHTNWSPETTPHTGDTLIFDDTAAGDFITNNELTGLTLASISITTDTGYTLSGNAITINSKGGISCNVAHSGQSSSSTIGLHVTLGAAQTWSIGPLANLLVQGVVSGSAGLTKSGSGELVLRGNNTYTATTTISAGTLSVEANNALGTTDGGTSVAAGATLQFKPFGVTFPPAPPPSLNYSTPEPVTVNGGTIKRSTTFSSTFAGPITLNADSFIFTDTGSFTLTGAIDGSGGLTKQGGGTLVLDNNFNLDPHTYGGPTVVSEGILRIGNGSINGNACKSIPDSSAVTIAAGATLDVGGYAEDIGSLAGEGQVSLAGNGSLHAGFDNASTTFSGLISGSGTFQKYGTGTLTLSGNNTFQGTTGIIGGTLALGNNDALPTGTELYVNSLGTFDLNEHIQRVASIIGAGIVTNGANLTGSLGVDNSNDDPFDGKLTGALNLFKMGAGTLTLNQANSYFGITNVQNGTLAIGTDNAVSSTSSLGVLPGAHLDLQGHNLQLKSNAAVYGVSVITNSSNEAATLSISGNDTYGFLVAGTITGNLSLVVNIVGTYAYLDGQNTYTGSTTVESGRLIIGVDNGLPTTTALTVDADGIVELRDGYGISHNQQVAAIYGSGVITSNGSNSATFLVSNAVDDTFDGQITGNLGLTKSEAGRLTLNQASTYTGDTSVDTGILANGVDNALPITTTLNVQSGALFDLNGHNQQLSSISGLGVGSLITNTSAAAATLTILQSSAASYTVNGLLSGNLSLVVNLNVSSELRLGIQNNYTGSTTIESGILVIAVSNGLPTGTALTVDHDGIFDFIFSGGIDDYHQQVASINGIGTIRNSDFLSANTLAVNNAANDSFDGKITGNLYLTKIGSGALTLNGANTYLGPTTINAGILEIGHDSALGLPNLGTTVNAGATLRLVNGHSSAEPITLNGGTLDTSSGASATAFAGPITLHVNSSVNNAAAGILDLSGVVSGAGGIFKAGIGAVRLSGNANNTYMGTTEVLGGTLELSKSGGHTAISGPLVIDGGAVRLLADNQIADVADVTVTDSGVFDVNAFSDGIKGLFLSAGTSSGAVVATGNGTLTLGGNLAVEINGTGAAGATFSGNLNLGANSRTISVPNGAAAVDFDIAGVISGGVGLIKTGPGNLQFAGSAANTFAGQIDLNDGTLTLNKSAGISVPSDVNVGDNVGAAGTAKLVVLSADQIVDNRDVLIRSDGRVELSRSETVGSLEGAGQVVLAGLANIPAVLTAGLANSDTTFSGVISEGVAGGGLTKVGSGIFTLAGAVSNTYTGATHVNNGTLLLNKSAGISVPSDLSVGDGAGAASSALVNLLHAAQIADTAIVHIAGDGELHLNGFSATIRALSGTGRVELSDGSLNGTLTINGNDSSTFAGPILGNGASGGLIKLGAGTLTLAHDNAYGGATTVSGGTLLINGSQPDSPVQVGSGATLGGTGTTGPITASGGTVSPGVNGPGILNVQGDVILHAPAVLAIEIKGLVPGSGYDQLNVAGAVDIAGDSLQVNLSFAAAVGQKFTIINNDAADPVAGKFANVAEGTALVAAGSLLRTTQSGGDGNDVVLTRIINYLVTGPDAGVAPRVRVFDATTHSQVFDFPAYPSKFKGGVRVATADVNGDSVPDIITAPGKGTAALVKVFSGASTGQMPQLLYQFKPYGGFTGGVFIAVGSDVNGDGIPDIITGPGAGTASTVKIFSGASGALLGSIRAFPASFTGGVSVAVGDVNGDGRPDIIAGMGSGSKPRVRVFDAATHGQLAGAIGSFLAYGGSFSGGVYVAAGDINGDGLADIITGPGAGTSPTLKIFDQNHVSTSHSLVAFTATQKRGVRVGLADVNGDGKLEILATLGPGGNAEVRVLDGVSMATIDKFFAEVGAFTKGQFVAGSR